MWLGEMAIITIRMCINDANQLTSICVCRFMVKHKNLYQWILCCVIVTLKSIEHST